MAETVGSGEPTTVTAGNTWTWTRSFASYAPSETGGTWTLSYAILGAAKLVWDAAWVTTSGAIWTVTIPAASTATLPAGTYQWTAILTGGSGYAGQRFTPAAGVFTVAANPSKLNAGDTLSFAEKTLAVVEAALEGRLTADMQSYSIGGRAVTAIPVSELFAIRNRLKTEVWRIQNPGKPLPGFAIRFGPVGDPV